jgi:hypothetical protein
MIEQTKARSPELELCNMLSTLANIARNIEFPKHKKFLAKQDIRHYPSLAIKLLRVKMEKSTINISYSTSLRLYAPVRKFPCTNLKALSRLYFAKFNRNIFLHKQYLKRKTNTKQ